MAMRLNLRRADLKAVADKIDVIEVHKPGPGIVAPNPEVCRGLRPERERGLRAFGALRFCEKRVDFGIGVPKFDSKSRKFGIRALPRLYFSMSYCTSGSHSGGAVL